MEKNNYCRTSAMSVCEAPSEDMAQCRFFKANYKNQCTHLRWGWACDNLQAQQSFKQECTAMELPNAELHFLLRRRLVNGGY